MALLTEEDVRRMSNQGTRGPVVVNRDQILPNMSPFSS